MLKRGWADDAGRWRNARKIFSCSHSSSRFAWFRSSVNRGFDCIEWLKFFGWRVAAAVDAWLKIGMLLSLICTRWKIIFGESTLPTRFLTMVAWRIKLRLKNVLSSERGPIIRTKRKRITPVNQFRPLKDAIEWKSEADRVTRPSVLLETDTQCDGLLCSRYVRK